MGKASESTSELRNVQHLVRAVLAAHGTADGEPADIRWEELLQVLLDLSRDRGLVLHRKDFAEAWLRSRGK